jgi:hypothetical protein
VPEDVGIGHLPEALSDIELSPRPQNISLFINEKKFSIVLVKYGCPETLVKRRPVSCLVPGIPPFPSEHFPPSESVQRMEFVSFLDINFSIQF